MTPELIDFIIWPDQSITIEEGNGRRRQATREETVAIWDMLTAAPPTNPMNGIPVASWDEPSESTPLSDIDMSKRVPVTMPKGVITEVKTIKPWTNETTLEFRNDVESLITHIQSFHQKWREKKTEHETPVAEQMAPVMAAEMRLDKALDNLFSGIE